MSFRYVGPDFVIDDEGVRWDVREEELPLPVVAANAVAKHRQEGILNRAIREAQAQGRRTGRIEGAAWALLPLLLAVVAWMVAR